MHWAPLPNKYSYFMCAARLSRIRPTDSNATCSARVPEPRTRADTNNNDVPSDGISLPGPNASSKPDVLAGGKCLVTRSSALRNSRGAARRSSTIRGRATEMSSRTKSGSRLILYSPITASRRFAESDAPQILRRNNAAAPGDHSPVAKAHPPSAHVSIEACLSGNPSPVAEAQLLSAHVSHGTCLPRGPTRRIRSENRIDAN